jgi:hypothetical protein
MRKIVMGLLLVVAVSVSAAEKASQFAVKSGSIKYELSGNTTGTKTLCWDNYGESTRTEINSKSVTKMFGFSSEDKANTISVIVKDKFWMANLIDNKGQTGTLPYYKDMKDYVNGMSKAEQKQLEEDVLASMGGKRLAPEKFMGYKCEVISAMGVKVWLYKGVLLKSEANIMGIKNNEIATEVKFGKVKKAMFKPSTAVKYQDFSQGTHGKTSGVGDLGGMFGALAGAVAADNSYDDDNDYDDDDDDDYELPPIAYSFAKFKKAVDGGKIPEGYSPIFGGARNADGEYMANYMKGRSIFCIAASSLIEEEIEDMENFEKFKHKGLKCKFGNLEDQEDSDRAGTALIVDYPKHKMTVSLISAPAKLSKTELLKVIDSLKFK